MASSRCLSLSYFVAVIKSSLPVLYVFSSCPLIRLPLRLRSNVVCYRCSMEVEGSILNEFTNSPCQFDFFTGKPERNCRFFPRMAANKAASSIMFMQYLES
ncbi:calcium-activated chloride channel regulator 4A-like, partial [Elysia marginata]